MLWEHYYNDLTLDDFIKFYKNVQMEEPHWYGIVMISYLYASLQSELDLIVTHSFDYLISLCGLHVLVFDEYCNAYNIQCAVVDENTYYEMCKVKKYAEIGKTSTEVCDRPQMDCSLCWKELHCRAIKEAEERRES